MKLRSLPLRNAAFAALLAFSMAQPLVAPQLAAAATTDESLTQARSDSSSMTVGTVDGSKVWDSATQVNTIGNNINNNNKIAQLAINNANSFASTQTSITNQINTTNADSVYANNTSSVAYNNVVNAQNNANWANYVTSVANSNSGYSVSVASSAVSTVQNLPASTASVPADAYTSISLPNGCGAAYARNSRGNFPVFSIFCSQGGGGG